MKKHDLIKVIWQDAQTIEDLSSEEEVLNEEPIITETVGHYVGENKTSIFVALMLWKGEDYSKVKYCQEIPKGMIRKKIKLKEVKNGRKR